MRRRESRDAFAVRSQGNLWGIERAGGELRAQSAITLTVLDPDVVVTAKKVVTMP